MRPLVVVLTPTFAAAALACAPPVYWKEPVGVSDKAEVASDQSLTADAGDDYTCTHQPGLLEGKPCAPEGKICGGQNSDVNQYSATLVCRDGAWDRQEAPPQAASSSAKPAKP